MPRNLEQQQRNTLEDILTSQILDQVKQHGDERTAQLVGCTPRTVRRRRANLLRFGSINAPKNGVGQPRKVTDNMWAALKHVLATKPSMTHQQLATWLRREFDVSVSACTVGRKLREPGWRLKVKRNIAKEQDPVLRDRHVQERATLDADQLVYIDESGSDRSDVARKKGYAPKGVTPVQEKPFHRGKRVQILPAYTVDGVMHCRTYEGSTDTGIFEDFIEELLPKCGRFPAPRSVLIMDNAPWHFSERLTQMYNDAGVVVLFLPPYSPDLNPIEEFFGELKNYMQKMAQEEFFEELIRFDFQLFIEECLAVVGKRKKSARGHFRNAGISVEDA
ncbi:hypothetical protein PWT90_10010 [Aphanocladium album]|nr:hypothetical protein PWT90_10010 [Aphanocladium album]